MQSPIFSKIGPKDTIQMHRAASQRTGCGEQQRSSGGPADVIQVGIKWKLPGFRHQLPRPSKVMGKKEKSPSERSSISLSATTYVLPASIAYLPSFRAWDIPHKAAERGN